MKTVSHEISDTSIIERAYQLADSGKFKGSYEIILRLGKEGYVDAAAHLDGPAIRAEVNRRCHQARGDGRKSYNPAEKMRAKAEEERKRIARKNALRRAILRGETAQ